MSEEQAQQLMNQMQMLENYYAQLSQRENSLANAFQEAQSSVEVIKNIGEQKEADSLIPIGMGTYVKTKVSGSDKFVISIGAGVHMEKDKETALNYLESRIKEVEVALQDTISQKQEISNRLEQGKQQMNQMISTHQTQKS